MLIHPWRDRPRFSLSSWHGRSKLGEVDTGGTALVWRVGKNIDNVE